MEKDLKLKVSQKIGSAINPRMRFAMVELDALEYMGELIKRAPNSAQLLVKLIRMMSPHSGGVIVVSRETMREIMGCSMPTVDRALKLLMEEGWVQRIRIGGANALAINHRVAWVGDRGEIQHAVFGATVVASRSEQDAFSLNPPEAKQVPIIQSDENVIPVGRGSAPPVQRFLDGVEPTLEQGHDSSVGADAKERMILEKLGQKRLLEE
jgi:hypothetical protein